MKYIVEGTVIYKMEFDLSSRSQMHQGVLMEMGMKTRPITLFWYELNLKITVAASIEFWGF